MRRASRSIDERRQRLELHRREPIEGQVITLVPYGDRYVEDVCRLRNADRARFFLNQEEPLVPERQRAWTTGYLDRVGDLYWMIQSKDGRIVGANALYDIAPDGSIAEKGRLVVDEAVAMEAPYALEADVMLLRIAFEDLGIARIKTIVRAENEKMNSMNARLGFVPCGKRDVRGVSYDEYDLVPEAFDPAPFDATLSHWRKRNERRGPRPGA
jgi:RimJ/RimL family protein N-acetyltransferase